ncbi:hypothetical protein B8W93_04395 [Lentilactobacillus kefiri]|nr:hypothetical protein B8W85_03740 [Lentilactobacillus kefiri]PAL06842.1 hypothetical protein B8W93_04395 [Lentilactobacillus kefiri]
MSAYSWPPLFSFIRAYHIITLIGVLQKWLNVKGLLHQNEAETKVYAFSQPHCFAILYYFAKTCNNRLIPAI